MRGTPKDEVSSDTGFLSTKSIKGWSRHLSLPRGLRDVELQLLNVWSSITTRVCRLGCTKLQIPKSFKSWANIKEARHLDAAQGYFIAGFATEQKPHHLCGGCLFLLSRTLQPPPKRTVLTLKKEVSFSITGTALKFL